MKYIVSILLLSSCASIPSAPHQDAPTHRGYWVDGFSDGETVTFWCKRGNLILKECKGEAKPCQEYCEGLQ